MSHPTKAALHATVARMAFDSLRQRWRYITGKVEGAYPYTPGEKAAILHRACMEEEQALLRHLSLSYTLKE